MLVKLKNCPGPSCIEWLFSPLLIKFWTPAGPNPTLNSAIYLFYSSPGCLVWRLTKVRSNTDMRIMIFLHFRKSTMVDDRTHSICDNPCGLRVGIPLHFWGLSSGIPWQNPCLHFNMPFLFGVGIDQIIYSSWTSETFFFFNILVQA
jgi:hypothetical protein